MEQKCVLTPFHACRGGGGGGSDCKVSGLGILRVQGVGSRIQGLGFRVWGLEFWIFFRVYVGVQFLQREGKERFEGSRCGW